MKRYAATFDCYIYADNDDEAIEKAREIRTMILSIDDNHASILEIGEIPQGSMKPRKLEM